MCSRYSSPPWTMTMWRWPLNSSELAIRSVRGALRGASCRPATGSTPTISPVLFVDLLSQVVGFAHLLDQGELGLDPVEVPFFPLEDPLEELAAAVVPEPSAQLDPVVEQPDRRALQFAVETELFRHGLADVDLPEALEVRDALQVEDPLDQIVGVSHLAERFLANRLPQPLIAPVV